MHFVLFLISSVVPLVTGPLANHRAFLQRRLRGEESLPVLESLDKSAGHYQSTIEKHIVVSGEKLNDQTCAAFKEQGELRVKELKEATKFMDESLAEFSKKGVNFEKAKINAKNQLEEATKAENTMKSTSVKVDAMAHVSAVLATLNVADELDPQSWQMIVDALDQIENDKLAELGGKLTDALNARVDTVNNILQIFNDPKLTSIEFCRDGLANHPEHEALQPTNPVKVAKTLQDVTASAVSVLHHTGRMVQVKDELKIETKLYDILDSLEKDLEVKSKAIMLDAFNGVSEILTKILSSEFKGDKFPDYATRKAELVLVEKTLKDSQTVEIADFKAVAALVDKVMKHKLLFETDFSKILRVSNST